MPLNSSTNMKLLKKSFSEKGATAVVDMVVVPACLVPDVPRGLHQATDKQQPHQRDGDEDLPAQAHDLVVTETGEGGADPDEHGHHHEGLDAQPDPAGDEVQE